MMKDYWTVKETAEHWSLSSRRVITLCNEGRVKGAFKFGNSWAIPAGTKKLKDERIKSGKYIKSEKQK